MIQDFLAGRLIYWLVAVLFLAGIYGIMEKRNFMKKLMGMNIMQVSVIVFFLILGQKSGATLPIMLPGITVAQNYVNPMPHALMLTAIVVSLSTTGVALALLLRIKDAYGAIEEDEIIRRMKE